MGFDPPGSCVLRIEMCGRCWLADPVMLSLLAAAAALAASKQTSPSSSTSSCASVCISHDAGGAVWSPGVEAEPVAVCTQTPRRGHPLFGISRESAVRLD